MVINPGRVWKSKDTSQFAQVLTEINNLATMKNFLRDVMTEKEILEISARLEAAIMLKNGEKYTTISKRTNLSSRTVARISEWLKNGCRGYREAIALIKSHHYTITG